jgi:ATP-binding cassette subfamily F protein 3
MGDLASNASALDVVMDLDPTMKENDARDFLALFDFRGDEVFQKIATLSGGEKGRLSLARIVFGGANFLLLDEPTNHLDLDAREQLEDALEAFEGAIVFVSHDRWFVDRIATQIFEIGPDGKTELFDGNYSDLKRKKDKDKERDSLTGKKDKDEDKDSLKGKKGKRGAAGTAGALPAASPGHTPSKKSSSSSSTSSLSPNRAAERRRAKNERILSVLEEEIGRLEGEVRQLDISLSNPDVYRDGERARQVTAARENARRTLEAKMWEWEETSRKVQVGEEVGA